MKSDSKFQTTLMEYREKGACASDPETNPVESFDVVSTTNTHTNTRLMLGFEPSRDACMLAITDMNEGKGFHIWLSVEALDELLTKLGEIIDDQTIEKGEN